MEARVKTTDVFLLSLSEDDDSEVDDNDVDSEQGKKIDINPSNISPEKFL